MESGNSILANKFLNYYISALKLYVETFSKSFEDMTSKMDLYKEWFKIVIFQSAYSGASQCICTEEWDKIIIFWSAWNA